MKYREIIITLALSILPLKSSAQIVGRDVFENNPSIDVKRALFGKIAGLSIKAEGGESILNNCTINIHGKKPLVLVDGHPRDLNLLSTFEIESVEMLTSATASALYGVRGANGIILVKTRRAKEGEIKVRVNYQYGLRTQWRSPEFANATLYAQTLNATLKNDGLAERYNDFEIEAFKSGKYKYAYPDVNWWQEVYEDVSHNNRLDLTFEGGNRRFRHYTIVNYMYDRGFFKSQKTDKRYSNIPSDTRFNIRTNLDIQLTGTTQMKLGLLAQFTEYNRANYGNIFNAIYNTPSSAFPIKVSNGMYGGSELYGANNPVALLNDTGNHKTIGGAVNADLLLSQDLNALTEGLRLETAVSFDDYGTMFENTEKTYTYRVLNPRISNDGTLITSHKDYGKNAKVLSHSSGFNSLYLDFNFNSKLVWNREFNKHKTGTNLLFDIQSHTASGRNNSNKRISIGMAAFYSYEKKYQADLVLNWSGSSYLKKGNRMMFYPALSLCWNASEESFIKDSKNFDALKAYATFGYSGWDSSLSYELQYQSFGSNKNSAYYFTDGGLSYGISEGSLPVERIVPEKSMKATAGIKFSALKKRLSLNLEGFYERRSDILIEASSTVSSVIGANTGKQCAGINDWMGADLSMMWKDKYGDFQYSIYVNSSFLTSNVIQDGQDWQRYDYLYHKGNPVGQCYGLEADGFFLNEKDIRNTINHTFATVKPGDIKYVDQNGDLRITDEDIVPIGYSTIPQWYYGFGFNAGWKNIKLSASFQGIHNVTVNMLNSPLYKPLVNNGNLSMSFLRKETPWTVENSENASVPRLTTISNANNYRSSSIWFRDGSFLKLRDITLSYIFPRNISAIMDTELYIKGTDLFSIDALKIVDPEIIYSGYPSYKTWWAGIRLHF